MIEKRIYQLISLLKEKNMTIAAAESCTGGLLSAAITSAAGASAVFEGSIISYANRIKQKMLGVDPDILTVHGAVSEPCAKAMAEGVRRNIGADIGVSITGIAGPDGGTPEKPVGTVYIGLSFAGGTKAKRFQFDGSREEVRRQSVEQALCEVLETCFA
ncbi:MAG: CinA family protein [Clostridiales bacterium]|nr:CinA family protein [Clostridiales bacterium]